VGYVTTADAKTGDHWKIEFFLNSLCKETPSNPACSFMYGSHKPMHRLSILNLLSAIICALLAIMYVFLNVLMARVSKKLTCSVNEKKKDGQLLWIEALGGAARNFIKWSLALCSILFIIFEISNGGPVVTSLMYVIGRPLDLIITSTAPFRGFISSLCDYIFDTLRDIGIIRTKYSWQLRTSTVGGVDCSEFVLTKNPREPLTVKLLRQFKAPTGTIFEPVSGSKFILFLLVLLVLMLKISITLFLITIYYYGRAGLGFILKLVLATVMTGLIVATTALSTNLYPDITITACRNSFMVLVIGLVFATYMSTLTHCFFTKIANERGYLWDLPRYFLKPTICKIKLQSFIFTKLVILVVVTLMWLFVQVFWYDLQNIFLEKTIEVNINYPSSPLTPRHNTRGMHSHLWDEEGIKFV
jgi:hypothetical protein